MIIPISDPGLEKTILNAAAEAGMPAEQLVRYILRRALETPEERDARLDRLIDMVRKA